MFQTTNQISIFSKTMKKPRARLLFSCQLNWSVLAVPSGTGCPRNGQLHWGMLRPLRWSRGANFSGDLVSEDSSEVDISGRNHMEPYGTIWNHIHTLQMWDFQILPPGYHITLIRFMSFTRTARACHAPCMHENQLPNEKRCFHSSTGWQMLAVSTHPKTSQTDSSGGLSPCI